jgi:hypothetical protein
MNIYTIVLFVHIIGAIGYFLGIGLWLFVLVGLRRAQYVEQVRALIKLNGRRARLADETCPRTRDGGPTGAGQRADWLGSWYGEQGGISADQRSHRTTYRGAGLLPGEPSANEPPPRT